MRRADLEALQPLDEIMLPEAAAVLRVQTHPCASPQCLGSAVPIGYLGQAGYAMIAYECQVCGEVEVRR